MYNIKTNQLSSNPRKFKNTLQKTFNRIILKFDLFLSFVGSGNTLSLTGGTEKCQREGSLTSLIRKSLRISTLKPLVSALNLQVSDLSLEGRLPATHLGRIS